MEKELKNSKVLSPEEERELFEKYIKTKDKKIEEKIFKANLKLVVYYLQKYSYESMDDFLDAFQEACLGLLTAIKKFDLNRKVKFSTFASYWIRSKIWKAFLQRLKSKGIRLRYKEYIFLKEVERLKNQYKNYGLEVSEEELLEQVEFEDRELPVDKKRLFERARLKILNFEDLVAMMENDEEDEQRKIDSICMHIGDEGAFVKSSEEVVLDKEHSERLKKVIKNALSKFSAREATIFYNRLYTDNSLSLREIGKILGITGERVRQIEKRVKQKLRREWCKQEIRKEWDNE